MRFMTIAAVCLPLMAAPRLAAQIPDVTPAARDSIMQPVHAIFTGMTARDTAMMRTAFAPGAVLGVIPAPGKSPGFVSVDGFLQSIAAAPAAKVYRERVYDAEIRLDGGLATAWMFYTFSVDEKLSHCGVDAFQLMRTSAGWKVIAVADTRRTAGCAVTSRRLEVPVP
ncbi:MAG: hypothetical protein ABIR59_03465 [Gemmatimonadales bacterium]